MIRFAPWAAVLLLPLSCQGPRPLAPAEFDAQQSKKLVGTWETTDGPQARVAYRADGTWVGWMQAEDEAGKKHLFRSNGTWLVKNGAIHNTVLHHDLPLPKQDGPLLSIEKLVAVGAAEYRYVCPAQGCVNTMRRVRNSAQADSRQVAR